MLTSLPHVPVCVYSIPMNAIENVAQPLAMCPACMGKGMHQTLSMDYSTNTVCVDSEDECMACMGEGEVTLPMLAEIEAYLNNRGY